jgi:hypothetical protein
MEVIHKEDCSVLVCTLNDKIIPRSCMAARGLASNSVLTSLRQERAYYPSTRIGSSVLNNKQAYSLVDILAVGMNVS